MLTGLGYNNLTKRIYNRSNGNVGICIEIERHCEISYDRPQERTKCGYIRVNGLEPQTIVWSVSTFIANHLFIC